MENSALYCEANTGKKLDIKCLRDGGRSENLRGLEGSFDLVTSNSVKIT